MGEIFGIDETYAENVEIEDLESERQTLIAIWVDESGSMTPFTAAMTDSLTKFKSAIKGSKESDEMLVAKTFFSGDITVGGYQFIDDMNTDYTPCGMTRLYDCIVDGQTRLIDYMEKLQSNGVRTKAVVAIFSDGEDTASRSTINKARKAIEFLKSKEVIGAFIAFGTDARGIAQDLGINSENILEVNATESDLRKVFMVLSKSAISASKNTAQTADDSFFDV